MVPLHRIGQVDVSADGQSGNPLKPHTPFLSSGHYPQMTSFLVPMIICLAFETRSLYIIQAGLEPVISPAPVSQILELPYPPTVLSF